MPREQLRELQLERVRSLVAYVTERGAAVPRTAGGCRSADIASLEDLRRLPFTRKSDLRDGYPLGMLAISARPACTIQASSGRPAKRPSSRTRQKTSTSSPASARAPSRWRAEPGMMLHNAYGYGLFTGRLGLHDGGERLGMTVVPVSGGMTERQLTLIEIGRT